MLYPISAAIPFLAQFTNAKSGASGLSVTVSVVRLNSDNTRTTVITAASATAATELDATNAKGLYGYLLAGASTGTAGAYLATFHTSGTCDLADVPALEIVGAAWVATAAAPSTDILLTPANKLATDSSNAVSVRALDSLVAHSGTAQAGSTTSITLASGASATDSYYVGMPISVYGGTAANERPGIITAYVGSTKVATIGTAWPTAPDATSLYRIWALRVPALDSALAVTAGTVNDKTGYTASTVTDKTGYSLSVTPPTAAQVAAVILQTPANLLATNSSNQVVASSVQGNVTGSVASVTADVGITQAGADKVWNSTTRTLSAFGFSVTLTAPGVQAVWDALTSALTTSGSVGKRIADNLDATVSSRNATAPDNTSIATILGRTDVATSTRSTYAGGAVASVTGSVGGDVAGKVLGGGSSTITGVGVWADVRTWLAGAVNALLGGRVDSNAQVVGDKTGYSVSGSVTVGGYASGQGPAALVLDTAASGHNTAGTIGAAINASGGAADPLANAVPGGYAPGTAGARLGLIGSGSLTITGAPVVATSVTLRRGDSYGGAHGNPALEVSEPGAGWQDLAATTLLCYLGTPQGVLLSLPVALSGTAPTRLLRASLTAPQSAMLLLRSGYSVQFLAIWPSGDVRTLAYGTVNVDPALPV